MIAWCLMLWPTFTKFLLCKIVSCSASLIILYCKSTCSGVSSQGQGRAKWVLGVILSRKRGRKFTTCQRKSKLVKVGQYGSTKNLYRGFWACWIQMWHLFSASSTLSMFFLGTLGSDEAQFPRKRLSQTPKLGIPNFRCKRPWENKCFTRLI